MVRFICSREYYVVIRQLLLCSAVLLFFTGCKTYSKLSEQQSLLVQNKITCSSSDVDIEVLKGSIKQKPNRKLLGLVRFKKWVYTKTNSDQPSKFTAWLNRTMGEEPVIYEELLASKSAQKMQLWLQSKGYYSSNVGVSTQLKNQKARVTYRVDAGLPYHIQSIAYNSDDTAVLKTLQFLQRWSELKPSSLFDIGLMEQEQSRIVRELQNRGYYRFTKDYIRFSADSSLGNRQVSLILSIAPAYDSASEQIIPHPKYSVQHTYIHINHQSKQHDDELNVAFDSIPVSSNTTVLSSNALNIRPFSLLNICYVNDKDVYQLEDAEKTQRRFLEMPLTKSVYLEFKENHRIDSNGYRGLDCYIDMSQNKIHAWSVDLEETNTSGDWGTELKTTYTNRNLFRGFERLQIRFRTLLENNKTFNAEGEESKKLWIFNTLEYGIDASLLIPSWVSPFRNEAFNLSYTPQTLFSSGFSFHQIPYYTRPTVYFSYGYIWKGNRYLTHTFTPIELRGVRYLDKSEAFRKFLDQRYYYKHSYEDYLISSTNYNFVYNKQDASVVRDFIYVKMNFESAGNILYALSKLANRTKYDGSYRLFETQFAQYLKADIDYRYYKEWSMKSTTVFRLFTGLVVPYGNQDIAPNIKKYTAGGASSMRGWLAQSLGPGGFSDTMAIKYASGDVRLETNIEHRFPLFWMLNAAVFTDIGNIWSINSIDQRPEAMFSFNSFYKTLAVDAGFGLRLDVSFFVLRTDLGVKLRDPASQFSNKWIVGNRRFTSSDFNLTFGIGYPF